MESTSMQNLPEQLISEILLRLPVKLLVSLKCVCKSWFSLISNTEFAKLHFDLTAPHNHKHLVSVSVYDHGTKLRIHYIDLEGSLEDRYVNFLSPFSSSPLSTNTNIHIYDVCRGFILLGHSLNYTRTPLNFIVWNPLNGIHKMFPYYSILSQQCSFRCRFEYVASRDDYFLIIAWIQNLQGGLLGVKYFEFLSMKTFSCLQVDAMRLPYTKHQNWRQTDFSFVDGAIHWLATSDNGHSVRSIIAFDFIESNVSEIPLPQDDFVNDPCVNSLRLEVIGECLCLLNGPKEQPSFAEIWMLKEYKVKSSWTKYNYVPAYVIPQCSFTPIYFIKGGEIVGLNQKSILVKLNEKGEQIYCYDDHFFWEHDFHIYTESLISLPSGYMQA
ncbi:hypothetical protein Lal_00032780 [Lupinus albus]|uniref:Putative F-box domain-containing protein n=1 Tax=Lupinus albus TaxID=3870 RepID=A0A6A4R7A5_LUPAL|nr:putative F-box domain-containing protein [Lupinus albus]KAF1898018.1 hypothetical protein Lal_00032780 [Lupinus albus]